MATLDEAQIDAELESVPDWIREGDGITRTFDCVDFVGAVKFVNAIVPEAEAMNHHPDVQISWNKVKLTLSTHSAGGLTANDFGLARRIDRLI